MLELMLVLAAVVPRFGFELIAPEKVKPWPSVTLRSAGGIPAVIRKRSAGCAAHRATKPPAFPGVNVIISFSINTAAHHQDDNSQGSLSGQPTARA